MATKQSKKQNRYRTMRSAILTGSLLSFLPLFVLMRSAAGDTINRARRVKPRDLPSGVQRMPHIAEPDDLAIGGVEEGHTVPVSVEACSRQTTRIALGLLEDFLRFGADLLGLRDPHKPTGVGPGVVRGPIASRHLCERCRCLRERFAPIATREVPAGGFQPRIDALATRLPLKLVVLSQAPPSLFVYA